MCVLISALKKRDEILLNDQPVYKYNKYFAVMRKSAHNLIAQGRQEELLKFLEDDSISIQRDIAGLLYHCYPEKCTEVLRRIGNMSLDTGLPQCYINLSISANMALENGIPKDYP